MIFERFSPCIRIVDGMGMQLIRNLQTDPLPVIEITMNSRLHQIQNWPELARQANWSVTRMAKHCQVSVRTFERFFHNALGECPHSWLFELRMRQAVELLRDGASPMETGLTLGYKYDNLSHFSRDFAKRWSHSPSTEAKMYRAEKQGGAGASHISNFRKSPVA